MINQYPLAWPAGWKRTQNPGRPKFTSKSIDHEANEVVRELRLMNATDIIINSNMQYRLDGMPYTRQNVSDTGVAVYFTLQGEEQCISCDKWARLEDNLSAIARIVNAMRGIERYGTGAMVHAAFRGFKALPEAIVLPDNRPHRPWNVVLGCAQDADAPTVKQAYRSAQAIAHPDAGGSNYDFQEVQQAYEEWKKL